MRAVVFRVKPFKSPEDQDTTLLLNVRKQSLNDKGSYPKKELNVPLSDSSHLTRGLQQSLILNMTVSVLHRFLVISNYIEHKQRYLSLVAGRDRVAAIATVYVLDYTGIESRWMRDFLHPSKPALRPTQPPVHHRVYFCGGGWSG